VRRRAFVLVLSGGQSSRADEMRVLARIARPARGCHYRLCIMPPVRGSYFCGLPQARS
jgi:hypothetical protein